MKKYCFKVTRDDGSVCNIETDSYADAVKFLKEHFGPEHKGATLTIPCETHIHGGRSNQQEH